MRKNRTFSPWHILFALAALAGLLVMSNNPTPVTAAPSSDDARPSDGARLKDAWEYAADVGVYRYRTDGLQTTHPTLRLDNAGRGSNTDRITVTGLRGGAFF